MTEFSLDLLLKAIKLARSTYYYHLKQLDKPDKHDFLVLNKFDDKHNFPCVR
ncbi:degenerate transposase (orf2) [Streptococcus pneumoniae]|nr:degenerate transposase (orf2) [Streptococcus pneumoniae]